MYAISNKSGGQFFHIARSVAIAIFDGAHVGERPAVTRIAAVVQTLRNVAIIAALAAAVAFLRGGGPAAAAVLAALTMIFLATIAWFVYRLYREQQLTLATLSDAR